MPARKPTDRRAAGSQLRVADQSARVGKDTRADDEGGEVTVPLKGQEFRLADEVGVMPLMEWVAASEGKKNENSKSLVAIYHVLEDTVHPDEWDEFRQHARETKCQAKDLGDFINAALEALSGNPTEEPSGS
jgi:hypothetical protein